MTQYCHAIKRKIDRWLELSDAEKESVKYHAKGCPDCSHTLASIEPVLHALDRSAEAYHHMRYAGPRPTQPEQNGVMDGWWLFVPKAGWAAALAAMLCVGVWYGLRSPATREVAERPTAPGVLRIPSMPSLGQGAISLALSPGALGMGIPSPHHEIGPSVKGHLHTPQKPETPDRDPQKRTSMRQPHHVQTS